MTVRTFTLDGKLITAREGETILLAAREHGIKIPTLCYEGNLSIAGACRLCIVEVAHAPRPVPSCGTIVEEGMEVTTSSDRLSKYRRMIVELLFSERNHVCGVCVSNGHCELQESAYQTGMTHVRYDYLHPQLSVDASHARFAVDHNRCIMCTRCVRVCDEVEGAHTWDVMNRGGQARVITDMDEAWGSSSTCTSCGKCVQSCPTGALFDVNISVGRMVKHPEMLDDLQHSRSRRDEYGQ